MTEFHLLILNPVTELLIEISEIGFISFPSNCEPLNRFSKGFIVYAPYAPSIENFLLSA
jgi:hypothetical protein